MGKGKGLYKFGFRALLTLIIIMILSFSLLAIAYSLKVIFYCALILGGLWVVYKLWKVTR